MPITVPNFPTISFQQANPMLSGIGAGQNILANALAARKNMALMPYVAPQAQADLLKAQLYNRFYGPSNESTMALQQAQARMALANSLKTNAMLNYIGYGGNENSQPVGNNIIGNQPQPENTSNQNSFSNTLNTGNSVGINQNSNNGSINTNSTVSNQPAQVESSEFPSGPGTSYGIRMPQPSKSDVANKYLGNIDTFSAKQKLAQDQIAQQNKDFRTNTNLAVNDAQELIEQAQLMQQLRSHANKAFSTGTVFGHLPSLGTDSQEVDRLINKFSVSGIKTIRDAMNSARFSNLDAQIALNQKPLKTWSRAERDNFQKYLDAASMRAQQKASFMTYLHNHPQLGADTATADQLWSLYSNQFPFTHVLGKGKYVFSNSDAWHKFVTPEAVLSVRKTGKYTPEGKNEKVIKWKIEDGKLVREE